MGERDFETLKMEWKDETGLTHKIPALDPRFCDDKVFPKYFALKSGEKVLVESWCTNMLSLILRCKWLLRLPHHKFWSYVVYGDISFDEMLDSYLINCPRYSEPSLISLSFFSHRPKVAELAQTLHRRIFLIFLRMSSRREAGFVMLSDYFGRLIYDNELFTIPRLMDLSVLYGKDNERLFLKMVEHIFKCQPNYFDDVKENCATLISLFDKCEKTIAPKKCDEMSLLISRPSRYDDHVTYDAINYLVDVAFSLTAFVNLCPNGYELFHECGITARIASLFENTVPILFPAVNAIEAIRFNKEKDMVGRIGYIEKALCKLFRDLVCQNSLNFVLGLKTCSIKSSHDYLDDYLESMSVAVHEKHFAAVYNIFYPFADDLKLFKEKRIEIDVDRLNYLIDGFPVIPEDNSTKNGERPVEKFEPVVSAKETHSIAVAEIRDIFPDLSDDVINRYLAHYDGNVEKVVNTLLTEGPPSDLTVKQSDVPPGFEAVASQRLNETDYDDTSDYSKHTEDEYGSYKNTEDEDAYLVPLASSKKRGLKYQVEDKPAIECSRAIYDRFQYETPADDEESSENGGVSTLTDVLENVNLYEDEYDDTYDGHNVNIEGDAGADEVLASFLRSKSHKQEKTKWKK